MLFSKPHSNLLLLWLLINLILGVNSDPCDTKSFRFFNNVLVTCVQFPDVSYGEEYLKVVATSMINHQIVPTQNEFLFVNIKARQSNLPPDVIVTQDPLNFSPDMVVGIALDGIPIYSALTLSMEDAVHTGSVGRIDRCGGMWGLTGDAGERYHYRVFPACISITSAQTAIERRRTFVNDIYEILVTFEDRSMSSGPMLLGYSLTGNPIYSPLDESGMLHSNLDNCNGKYTKGVYAYYTRPTFPYTVGCDGPGLFTIVDETVPSDFLPSVSGVKLNSCPGGFFPSDTFDSGCEPCSAGRYSATSKPGSECSMVCPIGHYCKSASVKPIACAGSVHIG